MGLWLTSSPENSKKKSAEIRCIVTHKTATTDSARPNNINSFRNHILKSKIFPNPDVFRFISENPFRISLVYLRLVSIRVVGRHKTNQKVSQKDNKTNYRSNISPIYHLNKSPKFIKSADLIILIFIYVTYRSKITPNPKAHST